MRYRPCAIALIVPCLVWLSGVGAAPQTAPELEVDVLVYGATSAGVIASYTAKQRGHSVLLVEPGRHVGGMSSGGLGHTDIGNKYAVTGLGLDFYRRLGRYYGQFEAWQFEPRAAEQVFESYLDEADVEVLFSRRLKAVEKAGTRVRSVTLEYAGRGARSPDLVIAAKQFIDATYEGDLVARSGASYTVGREPNNRYDEAINGVQLMTGHQFPEGVDPYVRRGDPSSGLLPEISGVGVEPNGTGDRKVQAYNFRMALCQGEQTIPIEPPDGYEPGRYELLVRLMEKRPWKSLSDGFIISRMPNGKTDWNNRGGFSTDYIGKSWDYPEGDYARRTQIWREHEQYQKGLLHFIATDPRVPEHLRKEMQAWGYCRDEFLDTGGWPHQLYVREARRLIGEYVMTEHNARGAVNVDDGVGLAAYTMDSHNAQRVVVDGMVKNEGNVEVGGFPPYPIAYRSLTPKRAEVTNLLVPVALSATHIVYGSIRMEPVFMVLGQAAAVAASMAIEANASVQEVDVTALQRALRQNPLADGSIPEVLVDDRFEDRVQVSGRWSAAEVQGRYGPSVLRSDAPGGSVRFLPEITTPSAYTVYLYWPSAEGLATNAPVDIRHAEGTEQLTLDLRRSGESLQHGIASWTSLGEFRFAPDEEAWLEIRSDGADGVVLADAVLLVPVRVGK
ncbi:MAG: FAD-dependent oxidoreductase [Luteitalea sp.]|nr:FAD-dependent oxidoreductase [Luteitalea sp.]